MDGIIGYVGTRCALPWLLDGLARLEERGGESMGLAIVEDGRLAVAEAAGGVAGLVDRLSHGQPIRGQVGIAHLHEENLDGTSGVTTHLHRDCRGGLALVYHGVLENHHSLRADLTRLGHRFRSETGGEVLGHLIETFRDDPIAVAVSRALDLVRGVYAVAVMSARVPGQLVAARRGSPLVIGLGRGETVVTSEGSTLWSSTTNHVALDDGDVVVVDASGVRTSLAPNGQTWDHQVAAVESEGC